MSIIAAVFMLVGGIVFGYYVGHMRGYRDGLSYLVKQRHEEVTEKYEKQMQLSTFKRLRLVRRNFFK